MLIITKASVKNNLKNIDKIKKKYKQNNSKLEKHDMKLSFCLRWIGDGFLYSSPYHLQLRNQIHMPVFFVLNTTQAFNT